MAKVRQARDLVEEGISEFFAREIFSPSDYSTPSSAYALSVSAVEENALTAAPVGASRALAIAATSVATNALSLAFPLP